MIYFDNASTTKTDDIVVKEIVKLYSNIYSNASSKHCQGAQAKEIVDQARQSVAKLINCEVNEVYFSSGATESINLCLKGYVESNIDLGNHLITTKVEHKAVLESCKYLESIGIDITYLNVDANGLINLDELRSAIRPETLLVSVLWVNNETGVIQDLKAIGEISRDNEIAFFVDATQGIAKMPLDIKVANIDMLCLSAHKFHGPKGVGATFVKDGINISPQIHGGNQESGLRSGTTNVPGIAGLAKACEITSLNNEKMFELRDYFETIVTNSFDCEIIGQESNRSPYISNVIFNNIDAEIVIQKLKNTMVSTGSACTSEIQEPSHVLFNMGYNNQKAFGSIRFSFSRYNTKSEIDDAIFELRSLI